MRDVIKVKNVELVVSRFALLHRSTSVTVVILHGLTEISSLMGEGHDLKLSAWKDARKLMIIKILKFDEILAENLKPTVFEMNAVKK